MTNWLKRVFALSDQGAKDLNKAIWCYTITNLSLLLPMCLIYMLLRQWILPLMGFAVQGMSIWGYIGLSIVILAIIYGLEYMGHVVERCADRSIGRLLQILYVVHVVLIPAFFL